MMEFLAVFTAPVEEVEELAQAVDWVEQYMDLTFMQDLMQIFIQVTAMGFCVATILTLITFAVFKAFSLLQI